MKTVFAEDDIFAFGIGAIPAGRMFTPKSDRNGGYIAMRVASDDAVLKDCHPDCVHMVIIDRRDSAYTNGAIYTLLKNTLVYLVEPATEPLLLVKVSQ